MNTLDWIALGIVLTVALDLLALGILTRKGRRREKASTQQTPDFDYEAALKAHGQPPLPRHYGRRAA